MLPPHRFEGFLTKQRKPSMFAGAGLSYGIVPGPDELMRDRQLAANNLVGNSPVADAGEPPLDLYHWSDRQLQFMEGIAGEPPKLRLAKALGILDDTRWGANLSLRLGATTPRHRVIARFAREKLWHSIWTWNWDCELERALEATGFSRSPPPSIQPWSTRYCSIVVDEDFNNLGNEEICCIYKPHGCAQAIADADSSWSSGDHVRSEMLSDRFMVGAEELDTDRDNPADQNFELQMTAQLATHPAMVVGWSISEPYLRRVLASAVARRAKLGQVEELSIIDITYRERHAEAANSYGLAQEQVFFEMATDPNGFTTDRFFLWLQAIFCIKRMAASLPPAEQPALIATLEAVEPPCHQFVLDWADVFVPTWTRLCWRGEVVECANFDPSQLDMDAPDQHIPLFIDGLPRPDLRAAARLFMRIADMQFDLRTFPGALWLPDELKLILPLPAWGELNELAALNPWVSDQQFGQVETVEILPLSADVGNVEISGQHLERLKEQLASSLKSVYFSDPANIGIAPI